jgi:hypothetical protein
MAGPPPGFALDQPDQSGPTTPPGFVLDKPAEKSASTPEFGSEEYIKGIAKKHGMDPEYVRGIVNSQTSEEGVKGFPILGAFTDRAGAAAGALAHPITGAGSEGSLRERYSKNLEFEKEIAADYERSHPGTAALAGAIGGTALTGGLSGTALGAKALGLTPKTLPGLMAAGAGSGGAVGLVDAAARGEDPLAAGGVGVATGLVAPGAGRVVSSLARPVIGAVRGALDPLGEAAHPTVSGMQTRRLLRSSLAEVRRLLSGDTELAATIGRLECTG